MRARYVLPTMLIMVLAIAGILSAGAVPQAINYQALILDSNGDPAAGAHDLVIAVYGAATAGSSLWSESFPATQISPDGTVSLILGKTLALDHSVLTGDARWLEISVDGEAIAPRTELVSSAYSMRVSTIDKAEAGSLKGALVIEQSAAKLTDASITLIGSVNDTIIMNPAAGTILRATNQNGVEVLNASTSPSTNSAQLVITGPGGDVQAEYSASGLELSSNTGVRALAQRMLIHPDNGISFLSKDNPGDVIAELREVANGEMAFTMTNHSNARLSQGSISLSAPKGSIASDVMLVKDEAGDVLMKTTIDPTDGARTDYFMPSIARATQKIVSVGAKGIMVYSENNPGDLLVSIDQSAAGDVGEVSVYSSSAKSGRANSLVTRINDEGVSIYDATGTNRVAVFDQSGNVQFAGIVAGGQTNLNKSDRLLAPWSTTFGFNTTASGDSSVVGGGWENTASGHSSVVAGGHHNTAAGQGSYVGGGQYDTAYGTWSVIGGGAQNTITAQGGGAVISGGTYNFADSVGAVVGGGQFDTASGNSSVVSGGYNNVSSGSLAAISGGINNRASGSAATVGGGGNNTASGGTSTVSGGGGNIASGTRSAIGGGQENIASGAQSTIPGGWYNEATADATFAVGNAASAVHCGSMVFNARCSPDSTSRMYSGGGNQFVVHAANLYFTNVIGTAPPTDATKLIQTNTGAYLTTSGTWTNSSDENLKENFQELDSDELLEKLADMPVTQWNYKVDGEEVTHIGPTAQDFHEAFGLGHDDVTITTIDEGGVALAAVKALYKKSKEVEVLKKRLEKLEQLVEKLALNK